MNRIRIFAIGVLFLAAMTTVAQQQAPASNAAANTSSSEHIFVPDAEHHLKVLTQVLDLSADQQQQIMPILQNLYSATMKIMQDGTLSRQERLGKIKPLHLDAKDKISKLLSAEQNKKLDEFLQQPHPDMHGNLGGPDAASR